MGRRRRTACLLGVLMAATTTGAAPAVAVPCGAAWAPSWSAPQMGAGDQLADQSARMIVNPHLGGQGVRLHLANRFGSQPVTLADVHVGLHAAGASLVPGSNRPVTFGGDSAVTIAAGAEVVSDPVPFTVTAFRDLAVSFHVPGAVRPASYHNLTRQESYLTGAGGGDHAGDDDGAAFTQKVVPWYFLTGVDVLADGPVHAVVAFGDSITDGDGSTPGANARWPDVLARRIAASPLGATTTVLNAGIAANRILSDSLPVPEGGPSALARLDRDALDVPGVTTMILFEGINDLGLPPFRTADQVIDGLRQIAARAQARGIRILGATLTPTTNATWGAHDGDRRAINAWIRTGGAFDGVLDFDAALRDPADPAAMAPQYDSGDHLHPGDAGYRALAGAVPLDELVPLPAGCGAASTVVRVRVARLRGGRVSVRGSVARADGRGASCAGGIVAVEALRGDRRHLTAARLTRACRFALHLAAPRGCGRLRTRVWFYGTRDLAPAQRRATAARGCRA